MSNLEQRESAHFLRRRQILQGAMAAALPASLLSCGAEKGSPALVVGGLPGSCNLTLPVSCTPPLPVACVARAAANTAAGSARPQFAYEYSKYSGWPEIKESLMAGR